MLLISLYQWKWCHMFTFYAVCDEWSSGSNIYFNILINMMDIFKKYTKRCINFEILHIKIFKKLRHFLWRVFKIDKTLYLNTRTATIFTLSMILEFENIWNVLGANYEHSHYSVENKLNCLYQGFDSTDILVIQTYFRKNLLPAHFK